MQNPSKSLQAPPSMAIGNEEHMHDHSPESLTHGNSKNRRKNSMGTVTEIKKEHIYIYNLNNILSLYNESYRLFREYTSQDIPNRESSIDQMVKFI